MRQVRKQHPAKKRKQIKPRTNSPQEKEPSVAKEKCTRGKEGAVEGGTEGGKIKGNRKGPHRQERWEISLKIRGAQHRRKTKVNLERGEKKDKKCSALEACREHVFRGQGRGGAPPTKRRRDAFQKQKQGTKKGTLGRKSKVSGGAPGKKRGKQRRHEGISEGGEKKGEAGASQLTSTQNRKQKKNPKKKKQTTKNTKKPLAPKGYNTANRPDGGSMTKKEKTVQRPTRDVESRTQNTRLGLNPNG